ncbi:MAG: tetratricopeptide repeat protein [Clostridium sp.]|nr:tetratricopeptide repeat protein [Clostridium sp.]
MLEQQKHPNEDKGHDAEISDIRKKDEKVLNTLEKARVFHEKYLLRSNSSDLESAVNYYIQAIKLNPSIPETYYRLASLLFENGEISLDSAIEQCKMAVNIDPENTNAHIYTGYFLKLANDFEEAEKEFKNAIKINPIKSARPRLILASLLYEKINNVKPSFIDFIRMVYYACSGCLTVLWDFPSLKMMYKNVSDDALVFMYKTYGGFFEKIKNSSMAVAAYDAAAENTGRDEFFYNKIGDICIKEHAPEIAIDAYKKVLDANPYDREALIKLATVIQTYFPENYDDAIDAYTKLLEIEPDNDKVYYELGHLYLQKNDSLPAVNAFSMALEKDDDNPFYHNSMAFALVQLEQYDDAIEHYQKAININPDPYWTSIVCQALGSVYFEIKENPEAAVVLYQTAAVLNPENDECHIAIGDTYFSVDDYDNAIKAYCDAIKINPENPKSYCKCGMALWEKDYTEEAIVAYHKAINLNPEYSIAYNNLGVIYLDDIGNVQESIDMFNKALAGNKSYTLAYFNLGRAYTILGENTKAAKNFQKALDLNVLTNDLEEQDILNRLYRLFEV